MYAAIFELFNVLTGGLNTIAKGGKGLLSFLGFASGGYTGDGRRNEPAGLVHKGEGVFSQEDMRKVGGERGFNAMRSIISGGDKLGNTIYFSSSTGAHRNGGIRGYGSGGYVGEQDPSSIYFSSSTGAHLTDANPNPNPNSIYFSSSTNAHLTDTPHIESLVRMLDDKLSQLSQPIVIPMPIDSYGINQSAKRSFGRRTVRTFA